MKWNNRNELPKKEGELILAIFDKNTLKDVLFGRAVFADGEFHIWSNDMLFCHHGTVLPEKFTHWAYSLEHWKLLESINKA